MKENETMMVDMYELTMAQTYFNEGKQNEIVYFEGFFRKIPFENGYALMGGGDEIIDYIQNLKFKKEDVEYLRSLNKFTPEFLTYLENFKFHGTIDMVPDGTPVFGNEPVITVKANLIEAQIIETAVLSYLNSGILFTTAAKRMTEAAGEIPIMEFGARRANTPRAATMASKCSYIAGCSGTSNVKAGMLYGIPVMGTMAHSMVTEEASEYDAFLKFAKSYPNDTVLLVDTYDTLNSGIPNAIRVAKEYLIPNGYQLKGIRIDSGDLAYLSKEARKMLDEAGLTDTKICLSNGLNPTTIRSLKIQGAMMDSIGAGDNIASPKERVGVVYKLVAKEENGKVIPKIKVSSDPFKTIHPGYKKVYRFYDKNTGYALGDVLVFPHEKVDLNHYTLIHPNDETCKKEISNYIVRELQTCIFKDGDLVYKNPTILEKREYCNKEMDTLYEEIRRFENPAIYYVDLSEEVLECKKRLIKEYKGKIKMLGR